ncbi:ABC transporter ATP-binding protein [Candidatus Saccharibacteria bacterium]|nr:ABC transporter ATP-binding protein [Candidatus Saccharibacteria bacterium]
MKFFKDLISSYGWPIVILIIFVYLQVMASLALPDLMARIVNEGIVGGDMQTIYQIGLQMGLVTVGGGVSAIVVGFLASRVASGFARDIRQRTFEKIENFSLAEFNKFSTASLITRSTNDVQQIQTVTVMMLRMVLMAPFMAVGALQNAMSNAPSLSWIIAAGVIALVVMIAFLLIFAMPKFKKLQQLVDELNLRLRESLTGLRVIRAFNQERSSEAKSDETNQELVRTSLFVNRLMIVLQPFMTFAMNLALIAIVWFGAQYISRGELEIGNMMAFMQYAMQVIMSFLMISIIFIMVPRAAVSVKRIYEVLETEPSVIDLSKPKKLPLGGQGQLEFRNVSFIYPDASEPTIKNINFTAESGKTTAFIGSTGSGKTTLINLIPRFFDPTEGQILIDGVDISQLAQKDLREAIGYVPQKAVLFSGTVKSNITYGNPKLSTDEIAKITKVSQADEFIKKLKRQMNSTVSQGGSNFSGGQKQRLSIARALAVKPRVYLFDDSFSALDLKTDAKLRRALNKETKDKTVLIIGQRVSTIRDADKIIVLDQGEIIGQGTHQELLAQNRIYQEIAQSQLSEEELTGFGKIAEEVG